MVWLVAVWAVALSLGLIYSSKFSYKTVAGEAPIGFVQVVTALRALEKILAIVTIGLSIYLKSYAVPCVILIASLVSPMIVRQRALFRELMRLHQKFMEKGNMPNEEAFQAAKATFEMDVENRRRFG